MDASDWNGLTEAEQAEFVAVLRSMPLSVLSSILGEKYESIPLYHRARFEEWITGKSYAEIARSEGVDRGTTRRSVLHILEQLTPLRDVAERWGRL